jgi:hypothetical protein
VVDRHVEAAPVGGEQAAQAGFDAHAGAILV